MSQLALFQPEARSILPMASPLVSRTAPRTTSSEEAALHSFSTAENAYGSKHTPARPALYRTTELVLTRHSPDEALLILPMLSHLCKGAERWVTWILDGQNGHHLCRQELNRYGVDTRKLRLLHLPAGEDCRWLIWEALRAGTSEYVIASPGKLSEEAFTHLEEAAQQGNSHALLVNYS